MGDNVAEGVSAMRSLAPSALGRADATKRDRYGTHNREFVVSSIGRFHRTPRDTSLCVTADREPD
jgi:hypothetical protein